MEFLIISGLSGAGKSSAADILEDMDYYCVDNMPTALLPRFAELCLATRGRYEKVALVTDVREREGISVLFSSLDALREKDIRYRILYMEADTLAIVRRYKETRRPHPIVSGGGSLEAAVEREREIMAPVRERADFVINTTGLNSAALQSRLSEIFCSDGDKPSMSVNITAFGYKFGLPMDADIVFDVRFLPNPFYVEQLRSLTGLDAPVRDFLFSHDDAGKFVGMLESMLDFLLPLYAEGGRYDLNIAIGCTGGRHRSVAIAAELAHRLSAKGRSVNFVSRDLDEG